LQGGRHLEVKYSVVFWASWTRAIDMQGQRGVLLPRR
jgi:hypothetical protein